MLDALLQEGALGINLLKLFPTAFTVKIAKVNGSDGILIAFEFAVSALEVVPGIGTMLRACKV